MNKLEKTIFIIAEQLWANDYAFTIKHDNSETPAIILETKGWYTIETCPDEKLMLSRFNNPIYIGKSTDTIVEMLYYLLEAEKAKYYEERKDD